MNTGLLSWIFEKTYFALNKVLQANLDATALEKQESKKITALGCLRISFSQLNENLSISVELTVCAISSHKNYTSSFCGADMKQKWYGNVNENAIKITSL